MLRRLCASLPFVLTFVVSASAQNYAPTEQDRQWVEGRVAFLQKAYALDATQTADLRKTATEQLPAQAAFQLDPTWNRTLRSLRAGIDAAAAEKQSGRGELGGRLESQLYGIYVRAPLSYAKLLEKLEPTLPKPQVEAAYARMKEQFAERLKKGDVELKSTTIDLLSGERVELPSMAIKKSVVPPPRETPQKTVTTPTPPGARPSPASPTDAKTSTATPPMQQPPTQTPPRVPPAPPPAPPEVFPPAPPMEQWPADVDKLTGKYSFTPDQLTKAKTVFEQCQKRANQVKTDKAAALADAAKLTDAEQKAKTQAELNKPLDRLYAELTRRVTSLATMEQREKVEPTPIPPPATVVPNVRPAPAGSPTPIPAVRPPAATQPAAGH